MSQLKLGPANKQGNDSQDSKPNPIREHRSILLRRLQVWGRFERPYRRCDAQASLRRIFDPTLPQRPARGALPTPDDRPSLERWCQNAGALLMEQDAAPTFNL